MSPQRQRAKSGALSLICLLAWLPGRTTDVRAQTALPGPSPANTASMAAVGPSYAALVSDGKALLRAGQLDAAVGKFSAAIAQAETEGLPGPTLANLYCLHGLAGGQAGPEHRQAALASLQKSVDLDGNNADCRLELGRVQLADKLFRPAQDSARVALSLSGNDAELRAEATALGKRAEVMGLFADGRGLLKAHQATAAAQQLQRAIVQSAEGDLSGEERALLHYVHALALRQMGEEETAIREVRTALTLTPSDADLHLELAKALFDTDQFGLARESAQRALQLGLPDADDQRGAQDLIKKAKVEALRERLSFYGAITFGYDSNVLQGSNVQTINGIAVTSAGTSGQRQTSSDCISTTRDPLRRTPNQLLSSLIANYPEAIRSIYACPASSIAEWDLPLSVSLELSGRFFRIGAFEARIGYQFYQYLLTGTTFDHDAYNRQEHTLPVSFHWQPTPWLVLRPHIDLTASFTGLKAFTPYQQGLYAVVDATFLEGRRLRTRVVYQHQLRRSFDRSNDSYLDTDRDEVKLLQELRLRGTTLSLRGQLSYRLRSERLGTFESSVPLSRELETSMSTMLVTLGWFTYRSPLSYLSHEAATRWRLTVPWGIDLGAGGSFEYRAYTENYTATFAPMRITTSCPRGATSCMPGSQISLPSSTNFPTLDMPSTQRIDKTFGADFSLSKSLPLGFALDLSYSLLVNVSTIANYFDNRSYSKHQVALAASYAF